MDDIYKHHQFAHSCGLASRNGDPQRGLQPSRSSGTSPRRGVADVLSQLILILLTTALIISDRVPHSICLVINCYIFGKNCWTFTNSQGDKFIKDQHYTTGDVLKGLPRNLQEMVLMQVLQFGIGISKIAFTSVEELVVRFKEVLKFVWMLWICFMKMKRHQSFTAILRLWLHQ
ncbi:cyclin-J18-like [Salvia divinorum]|uniref:Cyclin-J18-like n=1 Tax=Salvia divinorum TaxID=28513 RepID=A0ABD1IAR9_SALDI